MTTMVKADGERISSGRDFIASALIYFLAVEAWV
jgi:hypothetical protein